MSNFDPAAFLEMPIDQPLERRNPLPAGRDYIAEIKSVEPKPWTKTSEDGTSKSGIRLAVQIQLQVPEELRPLGYDSGVFTLTESIMLDLNASGGLDTAPGKNNTLRQYREALGMNKPGEVFRFSQMVGKLVTVKLKHEDYLGVPQERVAAIAGA